MATFINRPIADTTARCSCLAANCRIFTLRRFLEKQKHIP